MSNEWKERGESRQQGLMIRYLYHNLLGKDLMT